MAYDQIIVVLNIDGDILDSDELIDVADHHGLVNLRDLLIHENLRSEQVVSSVSVEELLRRERQAKRSEFPPVHSLTWYWRIDASEPRNPQDILARLQSFAPDELALAYIEGRVGLAQTSLSVSTLSGSPAKTYLDEAPWGVDARWAWTRPGGRGQKVRVIDLEKGWIEGHEDLPGFLIRYLDNAPNAYPEFARDHGAAVLGVIAGKKNANGATGIANELERLDVVSHYRQCDGKDYFVADAIAAAQSDLRRGDILVLEVVRYPPPGENIGYPTEVDAADHTAIRAAAAAGIVVIEAAGNSSVTLNGVLNPIDSGATIVGSCWPPSGPSTPTGLRREASSNHGTRVNCYSWGGAIHTAGYGDAGGTHGSVDSYTKKFGQTSGATAIIGGVAAVVQSWVKKRCINPLNAKQMRTVLSNPATGTPQVDIAGSPPDTIGVMPDLKEILGFGLWLKVVMWCLASRIRRLVAFRYTPSRQDQEHRYE